MFGRGARVQPRQMGALPYDPSALNNSVRQTWSWLNSWTRLKRDSSIVN